jgi:TolB protein
MQYGEEFRGGLGHIGMIGIREYILPFTAGSGNTAYAQHELEFPYLDGARAQGGLAGFMHPYLQRIDEPGDAANSLIPIDIALGKGDFYDVATLYSDEVVSSEMYYRLLNCGFRIPATSGSDNFSDVYRDPPPGADRAYVQVQGPLTLASWMDGIRKGRTYGSTGPLVSLEVNEKTMGDEIALPAGGVDGVRVIASAVSIAPLDSMQIIVNGKPAHTVRSNLTNKLQFNGNVEMPHGGWVAVRVLGPSSKYVTDSYAFAQTTPVYVVRGGKRHVVAEDGKFLVEVVNALAARTERGRWRTPAERDRFKAALDSARAVYQKCASALSTNNRL